MTTNLRFFLSLDCGTDRPLVALALGYSHVAASVIED